MGSIGLAIEVVYYWMETNGRELLKPDVEILFNVFESIHYGRRVRALRWGHNYYFEDLLGSCSNEGDHEDCQEFIIIANMANLAILADPWHLNFQEKDGWKQQQKYFRLGLTTDTNLDEPRSISHSPIHSAYHYVLTFRDTQNLLHASAALYRLYGGDSCNLPSSFWESRFWTHGETVFARSIRQSDSWKDWFFTIKSELKEGPNKMNLRNRKRIWRLGVELINLVRAIKEPDRLLYGDIDAIMQGQMRSSMASGLAKRFDFQGCRELTQRFVRLGNKSRLCAVIPSYVLLSNRQLISGLSFVFSNGKYVDVGYVVSRQRGGYFDSTAVPKFLWLVSSQLGFEAISIDAYPQQVLDGFTSNHGNKVAVSKWSLENLKGVYLGLDAMRIVSIGIDVGKQDSLDDVLWTPHCTLSTPSISMHEDDMAALHKLQRKSFAPASIHCVNSGNGQLVGIKVYSPLGYCAGITGIGFVYDTDFESIWGSADDVASLVFFLDKAERLVTVTVYKIGSLVCHLQFTTDLNRTSSPFPQLPINPDVSFECVKYEALHDGDITGFCGCFVGSSKQLNCFGVIPEIMAVSSKSAWVPPKVYASISPSKSQLPDMPLGDIRNHGQHQSRILLGKKYQSVQASINPVESNYRRAGQVTGLLFRTTADQSHPELLGQWTGAGDTYYLNEGEQIVDLEVTTAKPIRKQMSRRRLSQVKNITIVTNQRRVKWDLAGTLIWGGGCVVDMNQGTHSVTEILWEFNAMFDRVQCTVLDHS
ncbi:uncharacterized protein BP5553_00310 [Venustampulla echinocandica]|uniref:DUF7600 domain-containing protein n=1 Tax=Venustampulla echinocandica TaxID=2656787 RepID=A0A370TXT9_9HELO|nr:uncharacterized protein BP5553_00310 [Venustampulla echinocandica]RDL40331.1 hypothetical protein BP5553_00310 [Venustampulla echinocandica]